MTLILGSTQPRLYTAPLAANSRGLPKRTRGHALVRFARQLGEPLWPWQRELALRGLETLDSGGYRFRIVLVLVARQNGKTMLLRLLALWRLFDQDVRLVVAAGQDRSRAFEVWEDAIEAIEAHPELSQRLGKVWRRTNDEYFRVLDATGAPAGRYRIKAATRSSGRGPSADLVPFDELREQTDWQGWAALSKTTMAREDGQVWGFSNAGDRKAVVLRHLRAVALAGSDPSIGIFEWSAPDGCALDDRRAWAQANPSMNRPGGISQTAIRTAMVTDPADVFRTEVLCQFVEVADSAVDAGAWAASADPTLDHRRDDWVACVDVAPDSEHVTLALAAVLPDGRVRVEIADAWESEPSKTATDRARRALPGLLEQIKPRKVVWFPSGPARAIASVLRGPVPISKSAKAKAHDHVVEVKGVHVGEACMGFADLVGARLVVHSGDPLLAAHVTGAERLPEGDGWRFVRAGAAHVDAAYAAAGAVHVAVAHPPDPPRERPRIIVPRRHT